MEFKNDLGKPWRYEDGEYTVTRSSVWSPPGCHPTSCGVKFYVDKDGKLQKVEGDENHPITKGRLCPRCLALRDYVYNPSRVIYPMKRDPKDRGKDKWEQITWDEAYDIIEGKVKYYKATYGAECIAGFEGTGRDGGIEIQTCAHRAFGTPNACYTQSGFACYTPRMCGTTYVLGGAYPEIDYAGGLEGTFDNPAYTVPELIMLWGKEPLPSNGDGLFGHAVIDMMKRGAKIVSIDPRVNWLSTRAVKRLRLRPGTDCALGMAMLDTIIKEDLYDHDFVDKWCYGFEQFAERVATMPASKAAEICCLKEEDIVEVARMFANAHPAQIAWGLAIDQTPNGMQAGHCILALMAICGNVDVPGGMLVSGPGSSSSQFPTTGWESMSKELQDKIIGLEEYPAYCARTFQAQADLMLEALETDEPYKLRMGWFQATNLLAPTNSAQPKRWHDALLRLEFVFGMDCFITPTIMAHADVFLPISTTAEHDAYTFTHYGATPITMGAMTKCINVGDCKSDQEIIWDLGHRIQPELWEQFSDFYDFLDYRRGRGEYHWRDLHEEVYHQKGVEYRKYETGGLRLDEKPGFMTPTGRIELYSTMFAKYGEDPLPYFFEPPLSPISNPKVYEECPFVLTTGSRTYTYFHSEHRQIARLREINPNPIVEINPGDASRLGVTDGQWVELYNPLGEAKFKAKISPIVKSGVVHAQHGWWFPEEDGEEPNLFGVWKSNINSLVPHKAIGKLGFGAPYKCGLCNVRPLAENYDTDMSFVWEKFGKLEV